MRIAVVCKSPLLQKSLELFLADYLGTLKHCDIVVCDDKSVANDRSIYISQAEDADLHKPFTAGELFQVIEKMLVDKEIPIEGNANTIATIKRDEPIPLPQEESRVDFSVLQERIEQLTAQYQEDILKAIKLFYEKQ